MKWNLFTGSIIAMMAADTLFASDDLDLEFLLAADLEDLMNISVVTPSRTSQRLFEAPVSTSVVTEQQIRQSGVTTLPEALRLVPGVIVRELTNGQFDVHIRGLDSVPTNKGMPDSFNKSTLVMIDHRPVYNHYNGAMLWQELPVDIHDVDRIEVVRGPVGSLYGANAATGVIHFITHSASSERNHISWEKGEYQTDNLRARFAAKLNESTAFAGSFSHNKRDRTDNLYYSFADTEYVPVEQVKPFGSSQPINVDARYSDPELAIDKTAINLFLDIEGESGALTRWSLGMASSDTQNVLLTRSTPLGLYHSEHRYAGVHHNDQNYSFSLNTRQGSLDADSLNDLDFEYDHIQGTFEYRAIDDIPYSLSFALSYEYVEYESEFFPKDADQKNPALSVQGHYDISNRLRLTTAVRADYFSVQDKAYTSWSLGLNYRYSDRMNGRIYMGRSYQSPFFDETYFDFDVPIQNGTATFKGNEDLDLVTIDSAEFGVRFKVTKEQLLDWEVFVAQSDNYSDIETTTTLSGGQVLSDSTFQDISVEATIVGSTLSLQSTWFSSLSSTVYVTAQDTDLEKVTGPNGTTSDQHHEATPTYYGGLVVNYQPVSDWNINVNAYYLDEQRSDLRDVDEDSLPEDAYSDDSRWILNTKISYQFNHYATGYINGRNLVNSRQPQRQYMDHLNRVWLAGVSLDF